MGLGSGIRNKPIPDPGPGVKKAPDSGSGSATLPTTILNTEGRKLYNQFSNDKGIYILLKKQYFNRFWGKAIISHL
jgi:hypothetical protein